MVGLERMLDYRGVRLERFHCIFAGHHNIHWVQIGHSSNKTHMHLHLVGFYSHFGDWQDNLNRFIHCDHSLPSVHMTHVWHKY